jgi:hypothetical protein
MEVSPLQVFNEFITISLCIAAAYLAAAFLSLVAVRLALRFRGSPTTVCRPGEYVHQALKVSGRLWDYYRTAALLFSVSMLILFNFGVRGAWQPMSLFSNIVITLLLVVPLVYSVLKLIQLVRYRIKLTGLLDLHMQMSRRLAEVQVRGNRVYPAMRANGHLIDNVIVGAEGIYALQLFVPPPGAQSVKYERGALIFQPCGTRYSLAEYNKALQALEGALAEQIGTAVTVLPVVVVPECRIETAEGQGPLLVSLQACNAFVSWRDDKFFLHAEDLAKLAGWLSSQTLSEPPHSLSAAVTSLKRQVDWPALV